MDGIAFGTDGWRTAREEFTPERVRAVAQAIATYLLDEGRAGQDVLVGYDARRDSRDRAEAVARVLCANGHDVLMGDRDLPTPLVSTGIVDRDCAGGVMITASHNPPAHNGLKFLPADGAPALPAVTDAIEARLEPPAPMPESEWGRVRTVDLIEAHAERVRELVGGSVDGRRVVYDAMHGSGRGVTDALLEDAGATVERLRCAPAADFGGTAPNPTPDRLGDLVAAVREGDADLGVANDGDADRIAVVTPARGVLDANLLFGALYEYLLETDAGAAVRTVSTSFLVDSIAEAHDQAVHEVAVGFKWVARAVREHDALMGGEESGGFTIRGHVPQKDGVLLALLAVAADAAAPLDDRIDELLEAHGDLRQDKHSLDCPDDRKPAVLSAVEDAVPEQVAGVPVESVSTVDGVKLLLADGAWLLVRPSGTEPKMRVYAEADSENRLQRLLSVGVDLVEDAID